MSLRSVLALSFTTEQVKKHYGIDVRPILKNYGLDNLPPAAMISQADELAVLADIAPLLSHDPLAPIKIGSNFGLSGYGVLAMMLMNCATIYDAIQQGIRYQDLTFLFSRMRFSLDNQEAAIVLEPCPLPEHLQRFIIDRDLAGTFQFIQLMQSMIGQKGRPLRVDIPYPEPAEANFYRDKLECPVNFNADVVRFIISSALLKEPMPNASSTALALYQQQCDEILQQRKHARTGALSQQIKHYLNLFHDSFPTIVECAEAFGRSERQFRRLLKEEGQQFQQLLDEIKREKAVQLLQQSDLSVERIALQLGYTEAAAFIRAFRKWTGSTPAQYRKHPTRLMNMPLQPDRNFDDIAQRFTRTIYDTAKGRLRLAALAQDFADAKLALAGKEVLDIGGGQGQFSLLLAQQGANIHLCDLSAEMLAAAQAFFEQQQLPLEAKHCSLQEVPSIWPNQQFDIVLNHAVLEWLENPLDALPILTSVVKPHGYLSLMFYNLHGHVWRQLMNGSLDQPLHSSQKLRTKGNAPQHPLNPDQIVQALEQLGFEIISWRGIRCIYDHLHQKIRDRKAEQELMEADLAFGLQNPYKSLGRYIHLLAVNRSTTA